MAYLPPLGSVVAFQSDPSQLQASVTGTVAIRNIPSIYGNISGSVVAFQGTTPWVVANQGSVGAVIIGGSIAASFTSPANQSVSGTVGASIIGLPPFVLGGSTNTSVITVGLAVANQSVSGTVGASIIGLPPVNVTVVTPGTGATNLGKAEDAAHSTGDVGVMALFVRNDSGSVLAGSDGDYIPATTDSSGALRVDINGTVSVLNSTTATLTANSVFTGTSEEVLNYNEIRISVIASHASATDGLSLQQSSDASNWDIIDTYSIAAVTGKTFAVPRQARYFRVVYTNGGTNQTSFRLQTIFNRIATMASSQRSSDGYTNETDLEEIWSFNSLWNGTTWDRMRGTVDAGLLVQHGSSSVFAMQKGAWTASIVAATPLPVAGSVVSLQGGAWSTSVMTNVITSIATAGQVMGSVAALQATNPWNVAGSVAAFQAGTIITSVAGTVVIGSIVGTYGEDVPSTAADKGLFTLGIRNDTVASLVGTDLDYTGWSTDSAGRHLVKPFAAEESRVEGYNSVVSASVTTLVGSAGAGLKNYITDIWVANTGGTTTLVTFKDGLGSILGYTIAPAGGGSNLPGLQMPIRTGAATTFDFQAATSTSVLYVTVKGYKAP